jgi:hypothetical protein
MFASDKKNRVGSPRRPCGVALLASVLVVALCPVDSQAESDDLRCGMDADCVVTNFDCSECGRCPDSPPLAVPPRALKRLDTECRKHPPARLARDGVLARGPMPACSPCMSSFQQTAVPIYRAACVESRCQAVVDFYQVINPPSSPSLPGDVSHATAPGDATTCSSVEDCVLTKFDCTACGRCPGSPPVALNGKALVELEAKCRKHPPARLNPPPQQPPPPPNCAKCPFVDPKRPLPTFRAACSEKHCQAIPEPVREPKGSGG